MITANQILDADDVGRHLGVVGSTIIRYWYESRGPGRRYSDHPFPEPTGKVSMSPYWTVHQLPDIYRWAMTRPRTSKKEQ